MSPKKTTLALALTGVLAMAAAGQAAASAYAGSTVEINNLHIVISEGGGPPSPTTGVTSFQITATNTATLNGSSALPQSVSCFGLPGAPGTTNNCSGGATRVDPLAANAPGGTANRVNNSFALMGPGVDRYSNSDSVVYTAQLTGDPATHTQQIAESEVQALGSGNANAEITSSTGFLFTFTISGDTGNVLDINFDALPFLRTLLADPAFIAGNAQANINTSFSLTQAGTAGSITWTPNGTAASDCNVGAAFTTVTCTELADGADLNQNLVSSANNENHTYSPGLSLFGLRLTGLTNGTWTLGLNAVTSTSVFLLVPEPGTISLLGLGLLGLGLARYRRKAT